MKLDCEREKLLQAFQLASAAAPTRSPKPVLQNVKLEAIGERAELIGTDLELGVRVEVPGVTIEAPGKALLPLGRFGSILRETTDATLRLESDGLSTLVRGERSEFRLMAPDPAEFPSVESFGDEQYQELPARAFRELIRRTVFATDNESSRYALGGVLLELQAGKIVAVGTDGRRLAMMECPAKQVGGSEERTPIVPTRTMQLLERSLADATGDVQLAARPNCVLVKSQRFSLYSNLVEGRFPRWRDVFPRRADSQKIELLVGPLFSAVRQAAILTSEQTRGIDIDFVDGRAIFAGRAAEAGQSRVELPVAYDGPALGVTLDPRYLSDFLKVLDLEKTITLDIKDAESAVVCSTDDGYGYVIMPLARER